ncbi:ROK family protein [Microbacterium sp. NPDC055683]
MTALPTAVRIGLDVGGTKIDAVALDDAGAVVARRRSATRGGADGVVDSIRDAILRLDRGGAAIAAIGIGVPGQAHGGVVRHAVNLGVEELALADAVSTLFDVPVAVENDVKAAALGAHALGDGTGSLALLNLGTGVAAGIVADGALLRGRHGAAGEIGHVAVDPAGPSCRCGQTGCIETLAGGAAVSARWGRPGDTVREIFDAADAGDPAAIRLCGDVARGAAAAIRLLALAVDPDRLVVTGGVAGLGERLRSAIADELRRSSATSPFLRSLQLDARVELLPSTSPAAALGAALLDARVLV